MKTLSYYKNKALTAAVLLVAATASAQQADNTFSVMTLNVDGLPAKIAFFDVNKDGPASAGSELISEYIVSKDCDIVAMQEDFNYRWEIWSRLFADYNHDEWSGGIMTEDQPAIDYAHLHHTKFTCDGLNMSWKKAGKSDVYERVAWQRSFGKFSHDFDDIITKGFRRHEMTLANGLELVVYNMHMDASSDRDEKAGNDGKDREARQTQWEQLRDYILSHLDKRPVIVMGDMNSYYHRDPVQSVFIEAIEKTGLASVGDAWVDIQHGGAFPVFGGEPTEGETLDKVIYINPNDTPTPITPKRVILDTTDYLNGGKPLGDHYPLIVTFAYDGLSTGINGVSTAQDESQDTPAYSLQGIILPQGDQHGVVIQQHRKFIK